jgi:hypothetical protein
MQHLIAEHLCRLRRLLPVVIADLPGGNHKVIPPQRLPLGREEIFAQVDVLVLLDQEDGSKEQAWRDALRPHGLENRIAAVLRSRNPTDRPRLELRQDGSLWRGTVEGLDRERPLEELAAAFRPSLDQLWSDLLERGRRKGTP